MRVWRWIYVGALALYLFVGLAIAADDRDDPKTAKIAPRLKVGYIAWTRARSA
jgi:hypothetical protein